MTGENIVCFAKDWSEDPTSVTHVMRLLAKKNRVLWLNSISMRTPDLSGGRDIKKIIRKLASFMKGAERVDDNLWVYTPLVLPFPHNKAALTLNRWILRATICLLRRKLRMKEFQLWTFLPNVADFVGRLGEATAVYYCVDEWSGFTYLDAEKIQEVEKRLCEQVDVVFATAHTLLEKKRPYNPEIYFAPHGVDHALFSHALDSSLPVPDDLARLPQPVLGFYGTIQDWVDLDLIRYLAERHPEWTVAMIGEVRVDVSALEGLENVHFLGRKAHSELPSYCKGFSVGIIPYILNERMKYVNPIKLREYLCAGLPIVSVPVPEVCRYSDRCIVADDYEAFERGVEEALRTDSPETRRHRSEGMRLETWEGRVADLGDHVMRVKAKRATA